MFNILNSLEKEYNFQLYLLFENSFEVPSFISKENGEFIRKVALKQGFKGKRLEELRVNIDENGKIQTLLFLGFGKIEDFTQDIYREILFKILSTIEGKVAIAALNKELILPEVAGEILYNVNYNFDYFKEKKSDKRIELDFIIESCSTALVEEINTLGVATDIARDLVNFPANIINPNSLAEKVKDFGKEYGFEVEVLDEEELKKLNMNLLVEVGKASATKSKLIIMRYMKGESDEKIALIGKGLTYDTGGLCIKPADSMFEMKSDMAGAGTVVAVMCALSKLKLRKNVVALIPACENAISGNAYRPSDIVKSMNGKTVEIINTDAEGRLALADAITYAVRNEKATEIVDVATLTGAIMVALGTFATGVFSNNERNYKKLEKACMDTGEKIWRMPLFEEYKVQISSDIADLKNTGGRMGGAGTAAKFLEEFVEEIPWMHLDIAGTAFDSSIKWIKKGATGVMVKGLYNYLKM